MSAVFRLFVVLVGLSPLFLFADGLLPNAILGAFASLLIFVIASTIPPGEAKFFSELFRPAALAAIIPAIWMLLQVLPSPVQSLRHPIWTSAEAALGETIWGSISLSPGATLVALGQFLTAFGLFFIACTVAIDRQRAETLLLWLAGLTTAMATVLIVHDLGGHLFLGEIGGSGPRAAAVAAATLGTVLTATTFIFAIERYETRRSRAEFSRPTFIAILVTAAGAFLVCWIAVILFASRPALFAACTGVGALVVIVGFRRVGLSAGLGLILAVAAIGVPLSVIAGDLLAPSSDLTLRFSGASKPFIEVTQRIISDTGWLGSGAGSFAAVLPIYQDTGEALSTGTAPTTAAGILIGLGAPAFWILVIGAVGGIVWLLSGALQRGRDSFFPAAGTCCGLVLLVHVFTDASLHQSTVLIPAMAVLGLALAQSESRSSR